MKSGVYKITNLLNNKCYIGSSYDINARLTIHKRNLRLNIHHSSYLQRSYNKYGKENFKFEKYLVCPVDELLPTEQYLMDFYQSEYNVCKTAGSCLGRDNTWQSKKVIQIDMSTNCIMDIFESVAKAELFTKISRYSIANAARGQRIHAGGFIWKYETTQ